MGKNAYRLPPNLRSPPAHHKKLFDFFKIMHYTVWEIRTKLRVIVEDLAQPIHSPDKALMLAASVKRIKEVSTRHKGRCFIPWVGVCVSGK